MSFYVTTPDLLRQRRPAPGARLHDDRRRRDGPPPPPARRGGLLPDRHRRARRAGGRRRARARDRAAGAGRPQRRALQGARAAARGEQRLLHPHHRSRSTKRRCRRCSRGCATNGYVYEGTYEGWYCPRCADFKAENEIDEGNRCPIHHIELTREQEDNYFFKLSAFQERARGAVRRARGLRRCRARATTRRSRSSARACATCRSRATS